MESTWILRKRPVGKNISPPPVQNRRVLRTSGGSGERFACRSAGVQRPITAPDARGSRGRAGPAGRPGAPARWQQAWVLSRSPPEFATQYERVHFLSVLCCAIDLLPALIPLRLGRDRLCTGKDRVPTSLRALLRRFRAGCVCRSHATQLLAAAKPRTARFARRRRAPARRAR